MESSQKLVQNLAGSRSELILEELQKSLTSYSRSDIIARYFQIILFGMNVGQLSGHGCYTPSLEHST